MTWRVISDFDGTISRSDTTDQLLEQFADPSWRAVEEEWEAGVIGSAECMRRQVKLLDVSKADLDAWITTIAIDPEFIDFVNFCKLQRIDLSIASDGIDYVIRKVLARYELDHLRVTANQLIFLGNNRYTLKPYSTAGICESGSGVCKCSLVETRQSTPERILYVGDGRSDFCVSRQVELVLAKSKLLTFCQQHELPHVSFEDFNDVKSTLVQLTMPSSVPASQPAQQFHTASI